MLAPAFINEITEVVALPSFSDLASDLAMMDLARSSQFDQLGRNHGFDCFPRDAEAFTFIHNLLQFLAAGYTKRLT